MYLAWACYVEYMQWERLKKTTIFCWLHCRGDFASQALVTDVHPLHWHYRLQ